MKLSTKILILIAPAILISTAVSSYIIFSIQKDALIKREESYLQLRMEKLSSHFQRSVSYLNSFSYSLTQNHVIEDYFNDLDNPYRELELIDTLQESIHELQYSKETFINLSLLDGRKNVLYYAESSNDPFADVDPKIIDFVRHQEKIDPSFSHSGFTHNSSGEGMLVRYDVLDKRTGKKPLRYERDNIFFVIVSVSLDSFNELRREIEFDTQSNIIFSNTQRTKTPTFQGAISVQLSDDITVTVDPAKYLIDNKVSKVWHNLMVSFSIAGLITIGVILSILYQYVIRPISVLDRQLQEVEKRDRKNIQKLTSKDEIARLSVRLYDMYEELDETYQKTRIQAERDSLTQLLNRRQFQHQTQGLITENTNQNNIWVFYIDLDNFKFINDKYGHSAGDSLLMDLAHYLHQIGEQYSEDKSVNTLVSRLSGDEFAIALQAPTAYRDIAHQFVQDILAPSWGDVHAMMSSSPLTMSIGIAKYPSDGDNIEKLLSNADTAMYQAKLKGKNGYAYFSESINQMVQRRASIEQALREPSLENELYLNFQPYISSSTNKIVGAEALIRWQSPTLGQVWPDEFIPLAEDKGLYERIDRCVIDKAFASYHELEAVFGKGFKLSINLSSAELNSIELAGYIEEKRKLHQLDSDYIEFEITETFSNNSAELPLLDALSNHGYRLAIDDFGSGYTSLTQLVQYPVQKIKFDRLFLNTLVETNNQHVLKPLIELCHSQDKLVTAEGIEDIAMHNWLAEYGCDLMQGFFYGKPMSIVELHSWAHTYSKAD
ncbi:EAL domain-containing protein [Vibrio sp. RE86]|uniref:putative bifunctional diguanylate cyclase/phosphodiesterase n=1 Tax=Vibrio sp. RE86 TaxID=2607605 RepID=UPI0014932CCE|nr:EAL domain-containing protein [Vibrio sp. RE86]NOH79807.1 EAL domain-containing protein [Vibrio sp. RE86]